MFRVANHVVNRVTNGIANSLTVNEIGSNPAITYGGRDADLMPTCKVQHGHCDLLRRSCLLS